MIPDLVDQNGMFRALWDPYDALFPYGQVRRTRKV